MRRPVTIKPTFLSEMPWAKFSTPTTSTLSTPAKRGLGLGWRESDCWVVWFMLVEGKKIKCNSRDLFLVNNCLPFVSIIKSNYFSLFIVKVVRVF